MNQFSAKTTSTAVISAPRADVWAALTDPELLPKLTPLLDRIDADGDTWTWHMMEIKALGVGISPVFTEHMKFSDFEHEQRIDYTHAPPEGRDERAGAEGIYKLTDAHVDGETATKLEIELTLTVELPLPEGASHAVAKVIETTMEHTGEKFSKNLLEHLGARELQPADS